MTTTIAGAALISISYRVTEWPDDMRIFYADHWYALVLPVTAFRILFFFPAWFVLIAIAIVNSIPLHIERIRHGDRW